MQRSTAVNLILIGIFLAAAIILVATNATFTGQATADCNVIKNDALRNECFAKLGILRQDLNTCDQAEKSRFFCYTNVAQETNNQSICKLITDEYWQPICYKSIAVNTNDHRLCDEVTRQKLQTECFYTIAQNTSNEQICRRIIDDWPLFYRCFNKIALVKGNVEVCLELENDLNRDSCILGLAKNTSNSSLCDFMTFSTTREICLERTS